MRILGLDPGFANFGWAVLSGGEFISAGVWRQQKSVRRLSEYHQTYLRAVELGRKLRDLVERLKPSLVVAEEFSHVRNAAVNVKIGFAWGLVAALDMRVVMVPSREVRRVLCGRRSATKTAVHDRVITLHPELKRLIQAIPKTRQEHPLDAAAVILTAQRLPDLAYLFQEVHR